MSASFDPEVGAARRRPLGMRLLRVTAIGAMTTGLIACSTSSGRDGGDAPRTDIGPSPSVVADPGFRIGDAAASYSVHYRVDDLADGTTQIATVHLQVRRPFESRREERAGEGPDTATQLTIFDRTKVADGLVVHRVPGIAFHDVRVAAVLATARREGLIEVGGQRRVAGRRCQVLRSGAPLTATALEPITPEDHVESCVDAAGIVLEETVTLEGRAALHRVATKVAVDEASALDPIDPGPVVVGVEQGGGSVLPVRTDTGSLGTFWELPPQARPDGFAHQGRFAVIPPEPERFTEDPSLGSPVAGTVDVFRRDRDIVVVLQGGTLDGSRAYPAHEGALPVDGGRLGAGEMVLSAVSTQIRFVAAGGRFVHVSGTLSPDDLVAVARDLVPVEGTGLVYGT